MHESPDHVRLFIAVDMPPAVIQEVERIQTYLKKLTLFEGNYTHLDGMHITLKFLGNVDTKLVSQIDDALKNISGKAMQAKLSFLDVFTSSHIIKVLYLNVFCPQLTILAQDIDSALIDCFDRGSRPFVSHVTLARIKVVHDRMQLIREINRFAVTPITFAIDHFVLKQSELTPNGSIYTDIARYEL